MQNNKSIVGPFSPPCDVIELDDKIHILVEVAGMRAEDFSLTMNNKQLTISGVRRRLTSNARAYHQVEIGYGEFRIEVAIPWTIQVHAIHAAYNEGFLQIELPREQERQINVIDKGNQPEADETA